MQKSSITNLKKIRWKTTKMLPGVSFDLRRARHPSSRLLCRMMEWHYNLHAFSTNAAVTPVIVSSFFIQWYIITKICGFHWKIRQVLLAFYKNKFPLVIHQRFFFQFFEFCFPGKIMVFDGFMPISKCFFSAFECFFDY